MVLSISIDATAEQIKKNYKFLVKRYHPDTTKIEKGSALETLKLINEAYGVLSNPTKRSRYDKEKLLSKKY